MPDAPALTQEAADAALEISAEATPPADQPDEGEVTKPGADAPLPDAAPAKASAEADPGHAQPTEPDAEPDETGDPFVYRAEGAEHGFPGAYADARGRVVFPKQSLPVLKQALSAAHALPRIQRELHGQIAREAQGKKAAEAARDTLLTRMGEYARNPEAMKEFLDNLTVSWPVLEAQARAKGLETEREADRQRLAEYEADRLDREQRPQLESMVDEALDHWLTGDYAVDDQTRVRLRARYTGPWFDRVFPKGETGRQDARASVMREDLEWWFSGRPKGNGQAKAEASRNADGTFAKAPDPNAAAKKENAKRTEPVKAPPAVAAGKAPAPQAGKQGKYRSTAEADAGIW